MRILDIRADFGHLCNELGFQTAVEIGTHQGVFADEFMARFAGSLVCVDPWDSETDEFGEAFQPAFVPNVTSRAVDFQIAQAALTGKYPGRVLFYKERSLEYAKAVADWSQEFVYIDGMHNLSSVSADLRAWWPKLKPGGVMAGHDYAPLNPELVGVSVAVNYFVAKHELDLHLTREALPSWYFRKPQ